MKKYLHWLLVAMVVAIVPTSLPAAQDQGYRVIVHPDNPADTLSKNKVSQILLKKTSKWDNGDVAAPVDLDSKSPVREDFSRDIHGRSVSSIKNYWQRQIFSGRGVPPPEVANDAAVISFVASNPGAIGYVSASARLDNVKEVKVSDG